LSESWVILDSIEQGIRNKVQKSGTPLKEWNINIYRGVLTGYNEAFIIGGKKKDELIAADPKSAELIRPILRGRDISRYGYHFANLWLINVHNGVKEKGLKPIDIKDYPAIKKHLDTYFPELEKRADKGDAPYNLRNCAYMDDFYKQKILWAETMRIHKNSNERFPRFSYDGEGQYVTDKTCFFANGENIKYVLGILNSQMGRYLCSQYVSILDDGGYLMQKLYLEQIPIAKPSESDSQTMEGFIDTILKSGPSDKLETAIDNFVFGLYQLKQEEIEFIKKTLK
jgi:TaqI-like C-terminal specificity domain